MLTVASTIVATWRISSPIGALERAQAVPNVTVKRRRGSAVVESLLTRAARISAVAAIPIIGGDLVSTGIVKQRGACQGAEPCESSAIANLTANDENYALAA